MVFFDPKEHRYFLDEARTQEVPSVSRLLEHFGYANFNHVNPEVLKAAQDYGKVVHKTLELYDRGLLEKHDPQISDELVEWSKFKLYQDPDFFPGKINLIEQPLVSKRWRFAGTPDRFCVRTSTVFDLKTGAHSLSHHIQTAFYKILIEENYPQYKVKRRMTVHLNKNGYKLVQHKDRHDETVAMSMLIMYHDKLKKGIINGHGKSE